MEQRASEVLSSSRRTASLSNSEQQRKSSREQSDATDMTEDKWRPQDQNKDAPPTRLSMPARTETLEEMVADRAHRRERAKDSSNIHPLLAKYIEDLRTAAGGRRERSIPGVAQEAHQHDMLLLSRASTSSRESRRMSRVSNRGAGRRAPAPTLSASMSGGASIISAHTSKSSRQDMYSLGAARGRLHVNSDLTAQAQRSPRDQHQDTNTSSAAHDKGRAVDENTNEIASASGLTSSQQNANTTSSHSGVVAVEGSSSMVSITASTSSDATSSRPQTSSGKNVPAQLTELTIKTPSSSTPSPTLHERVLQEQDKTTAGGAAASMSLTNKIRSKGKSSNGTSPKGERKKHEGGSCSSSKNRSEQSSKNRSESSKNRPEQLQNKDQSGAAVGGASSSFSSAANAGPEPDSPSSSLQVAARSPSGFGAAAKIHSIVAKEHFMEDRFSPPVPSFEMERHVSVAEQGERRSVRSWTSDGVEVRVLLENGGESGRSSGKASRQVSGEVSGGAASPVGATVSTRSRKILRDAETSQKLHAALRAAEPRIQASGKDGPLRDDNSNSIALMPSRETSKEDLEALRMVRGPARAVAQSRSEQSKPESPSSEKEVKRDRRPIERIRKNRDYREAIRKWRVTLETAELGFQPPDATLVASSSSTQEGELNSARQYKPPINNTPVASFFGGDAASSSTSTFRDKPKKTTRDRDKNGNGGKHEKRSAKGSSSSGAKRGSSTSRGAGEFEDSIDQQQRERNGLDHHGGDQTTAGAGESTASTARGTTYRSSKDKARTTVRRAATVETDVVTQKEELLALCNEMGLVLVAKDQQQGSSKSSSRIFEQAGSGADPTASSSTSRGQDAKQDKRSGSHMIMKIRGTSFNNEDAASNVGSVKSGRSDLSDGITHKDAQRFLKHFAKNLRKHSKTLQLDAEMAGEPGGSRSSFSGPGAPGGKEEK
ncbi:unnamed protein product [Amoebophrya sp. A25]|nr:unnamed protein product [Amoebophrya sp. A25]|eukprot:GSA25T00006735001.1